LISRLVADVQLDIVNVTPVTLKLILIF